jgi:type II secretory pathway pseudopilin PulG
MMKQVSPIQSDPVPAVSMQGRRNEKNRAGMTIVETMVALVVLAVFITGTCNLLMSYRKMSDMARGHYTAINIAKNRMELVRTFDYGQLNNFIEDDVIVDASGLADAEGLYRRTTEISNVSSNLMELKITVDLRNRESLEFNPANEQLSTYFAKYLIPGGGSGPAPPSPKYEYEEQTGFYVS